MSIREKELKKNKDKLAIIRSAEKSKIRIGPNQTVDIKGYKDKELEYQPTCAIVQELEESSLPSFLYITPTVTQYTYRNNREIIVNISNLTTNTVTISPRAILCELQPVVIDESVYDKIEKEPDIKKIF
jgi:hypothetical protein